MLLNSKKRVTAFGRFAAERLGVKDDAGVALSPAELEAIWNDLDRLRDWTYGMLFALDDDLRCWESYERDDEEAKRRWLRQLKDNEPLRFARLITGNRYWAKLAQRRAAGRPRGRHRAGLRTAWETKEFIQHKWREVFGHWYKKDLAYEIAAAVFSTKRHRITVRRLKDYNNNKNRRSKVTE